MDSLRWKQVEEIYHDLLSRPTEERSEGLAGVADAEVRREVESLLQAREESGGFLSDAMRSDFLALAAAPLAPAIGDSLGPYRIVAEGGAGAMGQVYRAMDTRLDREVALKVLPTHFSHDAERVNQFRLEAKAVSALNHPNIVTIHDIGQCGGTLFIVTEWISGATLRERMCDGKIPLSAAVDIAIQCAAALGAAHRAGILHRDVKPENIMIRPDGLTKLVDFGLAGIAETSARRNDPQVSHAREIVGTPRYMSPEQARGETLDCGTDIFSLGAVLYEMAYATPAIPGATVAEVIASLLFSAPVSVPRIGAGLDKVISKALRKDREERYATIDELAGDLKRIAARREGNRARRKRSWALVAAVAVLVAMIGLGFFWRRAPVLSDSDSILLIDCLNQTGDPVFGVTLKQGLAVQLEQSPRLDIFPDERVRATLRLMRRSPDEPVTQDVGREICRRQGLKALVTSGIAQLGSHYVITLTAVDSLSGDALARVQAEAAGKEQVLLALSRAASQLREKLGESVRTLRKFDALLDATTPSLEALQAYSLGLQERVKGNNSEAIQSYRHAIELDPNFAAAYTALTVAYANSRQPGLAEEAGAKAYALRNHASERERLAIMSEYYGQVTGDTDKRIEVLKLQQRSYPRDAAAHSNLAVAYNSEGRFEEALPESRAAVQMDYPSSSRYAVLGNTLIRLGRFDEAAETYRQAFEKQMDSASFHQGLMRVAFVKNDQAAMAREIQWAGQKGKAYNALDWQGAVAASLGQRRRSHEFTERILASVAGANVDAAAAGLMAQAAVRDAALGQCATVKTTVSRALDIERDPLALTRGALAMAVCGDSSGASGLIAGLSGKYPRHTAINGIWLPVIRAAMALRTGAAQAAIDALRPAERFEPAGEFWPQYLRGQAFLKLDRGVEAEAEFRKILDHRGQDPISPLYPLAKLGLAQAMLKRDADQSRKLDREFLADWKDADRDLPAVQEAARAAKRSE